MKREIENSLIGNFTITIERLKTFKFCVKWMG